MTAKQIWMQILTEEEETAIEAGRKEWQHVLDVAGHAISKFVVSL